MLHGLVDCQFHPGLGESLSQKNGTENFLAGSPNLTPGHIRVWGTTNICLPHTYFHMHINKKIKLKNGKVFDLMHNLKQLII